MNYYQDRRNQRNRGDRFSGDYFRAPSKIMGVCAGLANQFGWDVASVRIVAVLSLFFFTAPTFLAYIVAGALFY